ncbi:MAG: hypothetical protein ACFFCW_42275 [Candidatus Hodarchaeota archaeon]
MVALIPPVIPTEAPVLAFVRKHGGEVEESGYEYRTISSPVYAHLLFCRGSIHTCFPVGGRGFIAPNVGAIPRGCPDSLRNSPFLVRYSIFLLSIMPELVTWLPDCQIKPYPLQLKNLLSFQGTE